MRRTTLTVAAVAAGITAIAPAAAQATAARGTSTRTGHVLTASGTELAAQSAVASQQLQLVLPLKTRAAALQKLANEVTDPSSPEYRHFHSIAWLSEHYGASAKQRSETVRYLRAHGATHVKIDATGIFVDATMTASRAARVFSTDLVSHASPYRRAFLTTAASPQVPAALQGAVTGVIGLDTKPLNISSDTVMGHALSGADSTVSNELSLGSKLGSSSTAHTNDVAGSAYDGPNGSPTGCAGATDMNKDGETTGFTPNEYLNAYGYNALQSAGDEGQGETVALIEIDGFSSSDLKTFASCFGYATPKVKTWGVGIKRALAAGAEATLDLEILDAAAPDLHEIDVYETGSNAATMVKALTEPMNNRGHIPSVISASLGLCESDTAEALGKSGLTASDESLEIASLSGISVVAAAGDDGSSACLGASGNPNDSYAVNYPASSPWVTAVGGTNFQLTSANTISAQTVWNDGDQFAQYGQYGGGGGGTSEIWAKPAYQDAVDSGDAREIPDVSLLADIAPGYDIYCTAKADCEGGGWQPIGGTSAAAPLFAGGLALIDQALAKSGHQPLGLANGLLYSLGTNATDAAQVYDDVTEGNNDILPAVYGAGAATPALYTAAGGYDEASGWGGVNLGALNIYAQQLIAPNVGVAEALPGKQHPLGAHGVKAKVSTSGAAFIAAYMGVSIPGQKAFEVYSKESYLKAAGSKTVKIMFSRKQLARVSAAIAARRTVTFYVRGAIVYPDGKIVRSTKPRALRIR